MGLRVVSVPVCLPARLPFASDRVTKWRGRAGGRRGERGAMLLFREGLTDGRPDVNLVDNGNPSIGDGQDMQSC